MATVNVLIAVDGAKIATQVEYGVLEPGTLNNPTILGANSASDAYIAMVAQNSFVTGDQGGSELELTLNSNDQIRWSITTFGNNTDNTAYLYNGTFNPSDAMSALGYSSAQHHVYLPTGDPTETPTQFVNQINSVTGTIEKVSVRIQYYLSFVLVNSSGATIGYFAWDPFINVN